MSYGLKACLNKRDGCGTPAALFLQQLPQGIRHGAALWFFLSLVPAIADTIAMSSRTRVISRGSALLLAAARVAFAPAASR